MAINRALFKRRRYVESGASPFSPLDISGCVLWLDGSDGSTLPNDPVDTWLDKSGLSNDALQPASSQRPVKATWPFNSNSSLLFDGIDDYLTLANPITLQLSSDFTLFTVSRITTNTAQNSIYAKQSAYFHTRTFSVPDFFTDFGGDTSGYVGGASAQSVCTAVVVTGGTMDFYLSGVFVGTDSLAITSQADNIGVGGTEYYPAWTEGYISEIIIYDSGLSSVDRQAVEAYLISKWSL